MTWNQQCSLPLLLPLWLLLHRRQHALCTQRHCQQGSHVREANVLNERHAVHPMVVRPAAHVTGPDVETAVPVTTPPLKQSTSKLVTEAMGHRDG